MTPAQLCFVAFSQMWASKGTDQYTAYLVTSDVHAHRQLPLLRGTAACGCLL